MSPSFDLARRLVSRRLALVMLVAVVPSARAQDAQEEPFGAEDARAEQHAVPIPEPLFFDLVRPLGALQGEFEANILGSFPISSLEDREIEWAPEVEFAVFDGVALEFELPFDDGRLAAYKFAGQLTFGTGFDQRFIHGVQFIAEKLRKDDIWELSPLYLAGIRFNERWSTLVMLGYRGEAGSDAPNSHELLANPSIFLNVGSRTSIGLENNFSTDFEGEWHLLTLPQLHFELTDHVMIQAGVGLQLDSGDADGTAAVRLIAGW